MIRSAPFTTEYDPAGFGKLEVDDGPREGDARPTCDLRRRRSEDGDERSRVDDAPLAAARVLPHGVDRVLAAPPDSLDVAAFGSAAQAVW